jgi:uncharacterized Zn finger protein (UPF0148 family)
MRSEVEIYHCSICADPIFELISDDGSILCDSCYEAQLSEWEEMDRYYQRSQDAFEMWSYDPDGIEG